MVSFFYLFYFILQLRSTLCAERQGQPCFMFRSQTPRSCHEAHVLAGGMAMLRRFRPLIVAENVKRAARQILECQPTLALVWIGLFWGVVSRPSRPLSPIPTQAHQEFCFGSGCTRRCCFKKFWTIMFPWFVVARPPRAAVFVSRKPGKHNGSSTTT